MLRVAILDLYEGHPNQGMRCLREIIKDFSIQYKIPIQVDEFEVRKELQIPDLSYHIYISSGGPGSPIDSEGSEWENKYFNWMQQVEDWNDGIDNPKKHVFFICHSFQLACRYYGVGEVCPRNSTSFGVFPVHHLDKESLEPIFEGLKNPFYAVDSRDYQVINPNHKKLRAMGATILCIEKFRPLVLLQRALMGIRFSPYIVGTQFHPEADAEGMSMYLQTEERKKIVIDNHGEGKWSSMIEQLGDPDKIRYTHDHILPNFLHQALAEYKIHTANFAMAVA